MSYWYAVFASSGRENAIRKKIEDTFPHMKSLFPQRMLEIRRKGKTFKVAKALLPGYFFLNTKEPLTYEDAFIIKEKSKELTKSYSKVLGGIFREKKSNNLVREIKESEMKHILFLTKLGETIDFSSYLKTGDKVRIISGPLKGFETIIKKINPRKKRVTVSLKIFGVDKNIDLGGEMLESVKP